MRRCAYLLMVAPLAAVAGGSNYGITPGAHPNLAGKVSEWPVPTPRFARDPAVAPDGAIYIAVMSGNKVARFDPRTQSFKEWDLPSGHRPHGLLVDWYDFEAAKQESALRQWGSEMGIELNG